MKVTCDNCGKDYNVDESKLKKKHSTLKCTVCSSPISINKPDPEPEALPVPEHAENVEVLSIGHQEEKKEEKLRFGLYPKIIILMLIISLGPLSIFFATTYFDTNQRIKKDTEALMQQTSSGLQNHIDEWVDKNIRILKTASNLPDMQSLDPVKQTEILKTIQKEYPWMYLVFTLDPKGSNTARSDGKKLTNYSDRAYYKDIASGKQLSWQTLIGKTSGQPALVISVPIMKDGMLIGVVASAMTTDTISKSVATWKKGRTGFAFLVDETNKVIAHQRKEYVTKERNLGSYPIISMNKGKRMAFSEFTGENGAPAVGSLIKNKYGWALVVQQDKSEVYQTLATYQKYLFLIFITSAILVILIAWVSAKKIVGPILTMTDAANQISLGDLTVKLDIKSKDEIGLLANSITRMQTSLLYAMNRLKKRSRLK